MTDGRSVRLELVWEDAVADDPTVPGSTSRPGGWKVRIPTPSAATTPKLGLELPDA
jgi:hypothetical protein